MAHETDTGITGGDEDVHSLGVLTIRPSPVFLLCPSPTFLRTLSHRPPSSAPLLGSYKRRFVGLILRTSSQPPRSESPQVLHMFLS